MQLPDFQYHDLTGTPTQDGLREKLVEMIEGQSRDWSQPPPFAP